MKTPLLNRFVLVWLVTALPFLSSAATNKFGRMRLGGEELAFADSTYRKRQEKPDDKKPENERPDVIKEVPRSRRLPKPTAVIDRVRIKRPPVIRPAVRRRLGFH